MNKKNIGESASIFFSHVLESCGIFHPCFVILTVGKNLAALDFPVVPSSNGAAISEAYKNKNDELNDLFSTLF